MRGLTLLGFSVRALAQSALRAGFAPLAVDAFGDRDLVASCPAKKIDRYPGGFLAALVAAPAGPWMYTGGLENHPGLVERLRELRPLWGNEAARLRGVRRPENLAPTAEEAGCRVPGLRPTTGTALLKPRRGSGGGEIRVARAREMAEPPRGYYCQQWVSGLSASAVFVAARGTAVFLGATRQLIGGDLGLLRAYCYAGSMGPFTLSGPHQGKIQRLGERLANRFDLVGLFNVDLVLTESDVWVIEVNPRYSASVEVLEEATGAAFVAYHAAACGQGELPSAAPAPGTILVGKLVCYAEAPGRAPADLDALAAEWMGEDGRSALADLPTIGEPLHCGQPVATILARGKTLVDVEAKLRERHAVLQATLGRTSAGC